MKCSTCGNEVDQGEKFCGQCGTSIASKLHVQTTQMANTPAPSNTVLPPARNTPQPKRSPKQSTIYALICAVIAAGALAILLPNYMYGQGLQVGKTQGYSSGYDVGKQDGYSSGYNDGNASGLTHDSSWVQANCSKNGDGYYAVNWDGPGVRCDTSNYSYQDTVNDLANWTHKHCTKNASGHYEMWWAKDKGQLDLWCY